MTLEAGAGKNPVSHVGKLYNLLAARIASSVVAELDVEEATCVLVSQIGRPVDDPQIVDLGLVAAAEETRLKAAASDIVRAELARRGPSRRAAGRTNPRVTSRAHLLGSMAEKGTACSTNCPSRTSARAQRSRAAYESRYPCRRGPSSRTSLWRRALPRSRRAP